MMKPQLSMPYHVLLLVIFLVTGVISHPDNADGSRCEGVSCSPPLPGASCTAHYGANDNCCPTWYCTQNGVTSTIYGRSQAGSTSSGSSYSSSWSSSSGTGNGGGVAFPQIRLPMLNLFG